ncbi:hypothetical protein TWF281_003768 [Arthrobotrys megalospora]
MCHKIYTFSKCFHIDVSDDDKHFPPCICRRITGTCYLNRACNACIRYSSPNFALDHKRAVEFQFLRFRKLKLTPTQRWTYVPEWKKIVGLGVNLAKDWPDKKRGLVLDDFTEESILDALEDEEIAAAADGIGGDTALNVIQESATDAGSVQGLDTDDESVTGHDTFGATSHMPHSLEQFLKQKEDPVSSEGSVAVVSVMEGSGNIVQSNE